MSDRLLLFVVALGIAALLDPYPATAQEPALPDRSWEAAVRYDYDRVSDGRADWRRWTASLAREIPGGTLVATLIRQRRFDIADEGARVDFWRDLWGDTYGHLQAGIGPDARIRPQRTILAEFYQPLGAWELSGQYRFRRYRREDVHQFGPRLARYVGSWYLRTQTSVVPRSSTWALAQRVGARRFYDSASSYVDLEAGVGRGVELVGPESEILVTQTFFASVRVRHFFTSRLGLTAALRYSDDDVFSRTGGAAGLVVQW